MELNRRQFVLLTASAATGACCGALAQAADDTSPATTPSTQPQLSPSTIDAGPVSDFKTDDVYDAFRTQGVFVIRRSKQIFAISSICTHKGCKVRVQDDLTFLCKCHGSRFDKDGKVTKGPATRNLPRLAVAEDAKHHLLIDTNQQVKT